MTTVADCESCRVIGVGIDTARFGHHVTFLREDRLPATKSIQIDESRAGYDELRRVLEQLYERYPSACFQVRIDAAGQYADNLERFLRDLPWPLNISVGEPGRNKSYRQAHFPKRKSDSTDSLGNARFAVVEQPNATPDLPPEFRALREVASQLEAQVRQTTRLVNQLQNRLARVFPELAVLTQGPRTKWVRRLLAKYPTPDKLAKARLESVTALPYVPAHKARRLQEAAKSSVGSLRGEVAEQLIREQVEAVQQSFAAEKRLVQLLEQAYRALPSAARQPIETIPGIGPTTAAVLVAKVVSIDRFATPAQLVSYFGLFPEERSSGTNRFGSPKGSVSSSMSRQGNDLVRRYLWNAAKTAIMHNPAVRPLYVRQRARGKRGDVALGHCMRKLLHLVFAVWKTGKPFDPTHYNWNSVPKMTADAEVAAGHKPAEKPEEKVITTATSTVVPKPLQSNLLANTSPATIHPLTNGSVDFAFIREQITMERILRHLGELDKLEGSQRQRRGPCPIHGCDDNRRRSFSVHLGTNLFRCFHPSCMAHGNVLDLWAAVHHLPVYDAAVHLASTFGLSLARNREEEPVVNSPVPRHHT